MMKKYLSKLNEKKRTLLPLAPAPTVGHIHGAIREKIAQPKGFAELSRHSFGC
jgi:hypothetical protein